MKTLIAIAAAVLALSFPALAQNCPEEDCYKQPLEETITLSELDHGGLLLETVVPGRYVEAPILSSHAEVRVTGMLIRTSITQQFRNPTGNCVNGVYVFPLPQSSAVDRLVMRIGHRTIEGEIHERQQAREIFEQARSEGRRSSLLEQQRPDVFTLSVASLGPGEVMEVTIGYDDIARYDSGTFSMRVPLVVAPRYEPGEPSGASPLPATAHSGSLRGPLVTFDIELDAGADLDTVSSISHPVDVVRTGGSTARITLAETPEDRDFHLEWRVQAGREPKAVVFSERPGDAGSGSPSYSMVMMFPPSHLASGSVQAREQIFILDTSGSMQGQSIAQAKAALARALERLRGSDRFNIIEFNTNHRRWASESKRATAETIADAQRWVDSLRAEGGTNMVPALASALGDVQTVSGELRQIIFITDGLISNENELATLVRSQLGRSRLFTVGIGSAPNGHFMTSIARHGRGTFTWIPQADQVEQRMSELLDKIDSPALTGVGIEVSDSTSEIYPRATPDLYLGEPLVTIIRHFDPDAAIAVEGVVGKRLWHQVEPDRHVVSDGGLSRLWARRKIDEISDRELDGLPREEARKEIIEVAISHHLVSAHTSLVAVDRTPAGIDPTSCIAVPIPLRVPEGMEILLPRTGSLAPLARILGLILVIFGAAVRTARFCRQGAER